MTLKDQLLPVWDQMLGTLDGLLDKAAADQRSDMLLAARLADDMHPLATQVRFLCNMPGEALTRLAGMQFTSSENDPVSIEDAKQQIAQTRTQLAQWGELEFLDEDAPVELAIPNGMVFDLTAGEYARDWALAQFYFHVNAAYAILRKEGLAIGKAEYVPYMFKYLRE